MKILNKKIQKNRGMTYVELIVVLSIFAVLSSVAFFNYGLFQAQVDVKNLANDIAQNIVQAQKYSLSGKIPPPTYSVSANWKPSYGAYFDIAFPTSFIYFTDLNADKVFTGAACTVECLSQISITKGNYISKIETYTGSSPTAVTVPVSITFKRPNSSAIFTRNDGTTMTGFDYLQVTIVSPHGPTAAIKVYPSGRIQIN